MEFLLANHPLDCPICDQGGECDLQVKIFNSYVILYLRVCIRNIFYSNSISRTSPCSSAVTGAALRRAKELWRTRILVLSSKPS